MQLMRKLDGPMVLSVRIADMTMAIPFRHVVKFSAASAVIKHRSHQAPFFIGHIYR